MRGPRLTDAGDVVQLPFDGQERGAGDGLGRHPFAGDVPEPAREQVLLEHDADAVEVVLGRHVQHGVVLVVEAAMLLGAVEVPLDQMLVEVPVRADVAHRIHRHEAGVLQEARIDAPPAPRVGIRHRVNEVALEPAHRVAAGELVDARRAAAGVDRSAHHDQAPRLGLAGGCHQCAGGQHRNRGLTDRQDVQAVGADVADELPDVADVVVQREGAPVGRDVARVDPVSDVDLVVDQQGADGVAEERRVVTRERGDDQDRRIALELGDHVALIAVALETDEPAERLRQRRLLHHRHPGAARRSPRGCRTPASGRSCRAGRAARTRRRRCWRRGAAPASFPVPRTFGRRPRPARPRARTARGCTRGVGTALE